MRTDYANGTFLETYDHYVGGYRRGRAMCVDGVVRAVRFPKGGHATNHFSVDACCTINGKFVSGFVSTSTVSGSDVATDDDPGMVLFTAFDYARNGRIIGGEIIKPAWQYDGEGARIHYMVREYGRAKARHRWCEPGHRDYERAAEALPANAARRPLAQAVHDMAVL